MKEYAILENIENDRKNYCSNFWDNRVDMDNYYSKNDKILSDQIEKVKPMFGPLPARSDYKIALFEVE